MKPRSELVFQRTLLLSATDFLLGNRAGDLRSIARREVEPNGSRFASDEKPQPKLVTG